jgi:hypothetical protein
MFEKKRLPFQPAKVEMGAFFCCAENWVNSAPDEPIEESLACISLRLNL